jgi:hypothetical protein
LRVEPGHFTGSGLGARFYPVLYMLTRMGDSEDWGTGLPLKASLLGKMSKLEVHHIFPKAQLYKAGYKQTEVNAVANFCFLTKDTNLSISDRLPEAYFPEIEARHPGALASQWIPNDARLWNSSATRTFSMRDGAYWPKKPIGDLKISFTATATGSAGPCPKAKHPSLPQGEAHLETRRPSSGRSTLGWRVTTSRLDNPQLSITTLTPETYAEFLTSRGPTDYSRASVHQWLSCSTEKVYRLCWRGAYMFAVSGRLPISKLMPRTNFWK